MTRPPTNTPGRKQRRLHRQAIQSGERKRGRETDVARPDRAPGSSGRLPRLLAWLAVMAAIAVFAGTLRFQFVYDDIEQIVGNPRLQSWEYVPQYFTHDVWNQPGQEATSNYYRPLFLLWLRLNNALFGMDPAGFHASAVALHALATLLVYLLAARALKDRTTAGFAALIFAVHPLHVESVAWISGANEPEFAVFFLAAMLCYLRWHKAEGTYGENHEDQNDDQRSRKWLFLSLAGYACALLSKETAVMLCAMIFFYECRWPRGLGFGWGRRLRRAAWITSPYVMVTAFYLAARAHALKGMAPDVENQASRSTILLTLPAALWFYLRKMLWPLPMSVFYPFRFATARGFANFVWPLAASLAVLTGLWFWSRRSEAAGTAAAWLLLPLAPPLLAISHFLRHDLVHDRYLYLPSVGLAMLMALALRRLRFGGTEVTGARALKADSTFAGQKTSGERGAPGRSVAGVPAVQLASVLLLTGVLGAITIQQEQQWSSEMALYSHGIEVAPRNPLVLNHMAMLLVKEKSDLQAAHELGERALAEAPEEYETLLAAGILRGNVHDEDGALPLLLHAQQLQPERHDPYLYLGMIYLDKGQLSDAEASLRTAVRLAPNEPDQQFLLGYALERQNRLAEAISEYQAELQIRPGSNRAAQRLAAVEARLKGQ